MFGDTGLKFKPSKGYGKRVLSSSLGYAGHMESGGWEGREGGTEGGMKGGIPLVLSLRVSSTYVADGLGAELQPLFYSCCRSICLSLNAEFQGLFNIYLL